MKTPKVTYSYFVVKDGVPLPWLNNRKKTGDWAVHYPVEEFALIPAAVARIPAVQSALRTAAAAEKGKGKK